jgi:hypothetical protein
VSDAKSIDGIVIGYKASFPGNSVQPEEIRLVQAHLGELLLTVLMLNEED